MHFTATIATVLIATVGFGAAQTVTSSASSSTSTSTCQAENILQACLKSTQPMFQGCASTDYSCLCTQSINVLTCYNNCPNDSGAVAAQENKDTYCNDASLYATTTSHPAVSGVSSAISAASSGSGSTAASSSSVPTASAKASSTAGAAARAVETGGMVAAVMLGLVAAL